MKKILFVAFLLNFGLFSQAQTDTTKNHLVLKESNVDSLIKRGDRAFSANDFNKAIENYKAVLVIDSTNQYAHKNIMMCYAKKSSLVSDLIKEGDLAYSRKDFNSAEKKYKNVLDIDRENNYAFDQLKRCAEYKANNANNAKVEIDPKAFIMKGDAAFAAKDYNSAIKFYEEYLRRNSNDSYVSNKLAQARELMRK